MTIRCVGITTINDFPKRCEDCYFSGYNHEDELICILPFDPNSEDGCPLIEIDVEMDDGDEYQRNNYYDDRLFDLFIKGYGPYYKKNKRRR